MCFQVSVYDLRANLGSQSKVAGFQPSFCCTDFPAPLLETCKGDPDVRTGVLPALFKAQWTSTPAKPAQVASKDIIRFKHSGFVKIVSCSYLL